MREGPGEARSFLLKKRGPNQNWGEEGDEKKKKGENKRSTFYIKPLRVGMNKKETSREAVDAKRKARLRGRRGLGDVFGKIE